MSLRQVLGGLTTLFMMAVLFTQSAWAKDPSSFLTYDTKDYDTFLSVSPTYVSIQSPLNSLTGYGLRVGWNRNLSSKWNFEGSFSQVFGSSDAGSGFNALSSSLEAFAQYAVSGQFESNERTVLFDGRPLVRERRYRQRVFSLGVGVMQLLLNGSTDVYPATGLGLSASYDFYLWDHLVRPNARYGLLSGNGQDLNLLGFDFAMMFEF